MVVYPRASGLEGSGGRAYCSSWRSPIPRCASTWGAKRRSSKLRRARIWVIDAVRLTTRIFREAGADGYREARDFGAADRILPLFAPEAFALSLDELDLA